MSGLEPTAPERIRPWVATQPSPPFVQRSESLLKTTARLVTGHLEIWTEEVRPLAPRPSLSACAHCCGETPEIHRMCLKTRGGQSRSAMARGEVVQWTCPGNVRLTAFPIAGPDQASGALVWLSPSPDQPSGLDQEAKRDFLIDLTGLLSDQVCLWREMSALSGELSSRYDELQMLYSIAGRLTGYDDLRLTLRHMLEQARVTLEADAALVTMQGRRLREVSLSPGRDKHEGDDKRVWHRFAQALPRILEQVGSRYYIGSAWDPALGPSPFPGPVQTLAVSVMRQGRRDGCLALVLFDPKKSFRSSDIRLLESLAEQVALAVSNAELFQDLQDFLMATVKSLVSAIEAKDSYTSGHSERVNLLSMLIGKKMGLCPSDMETLRWASILHDVGKIGMPETILLKPGKLSPAEFEIIKEHPERGHRLLAPIRQLQEAAISVRAHHEMFDGGGYPRGLAGGDIPLLARIISVADTFDALTSTRPYRNARTLEYALEEISRVRGSQLDPEIAGCFLEMAPFLREHRIMIGSGSETCSEKAA
jgi:hypothetical protein